MHEPQYFGMSLFDSALSQRRKKLGPEILKIVMKGALRPLADPSLHPGCFFGALRLVGIDGTTWSVRNTPQQLARLAKAKTRKGSAAFAKISMSALVELGAMHAPLGAALGLGGESAHVLSTALLAHLPERMLLILDRLYGQAPMLEQLQTHCCLEKEQYFLARVRAKLGT